MLWMGTSIILESELTPYVDQLCSTPQADTSPSLWTDGAGTGGDAWAGGTTSVCCRAIWALRFKETWSVHAVQLAATTPV